MGVPPKKGAGDGAVLRALWEGGQQPHCHHQRWGVRGGGLLNWGGGIEVGVGGKMGKGRGAQMGGISNVGGGCPKMRGGPILGGIPNWGGAHICSPVSGGGIFGVPFVERFHFGGRQFFGAGVPMFFWGCSLF